MSSEIKPRASVCRCLEIRCVQVYSVGKCRVCSERNVLYGH